ncbi:MAG: DUF5596 domain-containing protein [Candidatus Latescibacteria bacterium]|nr:DUF5596 domain-containing protein [Candidatus Latescibacterota bacterium]
MELNRVVEDLGIEPSREVLEPAWEVSQRVMADGEVPFLSPDFVSEACRGIYLPEDIVEAAVAAAARVANEPALRALAWHCHWCLYHVEGYSSRLADDWPCMKGPLGELAGLFYLLVLLSRFPQMRATHRAHGVSERVVRESMDQIYLRGESCSEIFGQWGLDGHAARWLANFLRGEIYALGRLEHQFNVMNDPFRVYRHRESSVVVALSEDGVSFRRDGQRHRGGDAPPAWTSRLRITGDRIAGHPILPSGRACEEMVTLAAADWVSVLGPGDPVLYFHIPGGIPLDHTACGDSFRAAMDFFPRHFPDRPYKAFFCGSWLLDTQLEDWLPSGSNLVRFLREFYLVPGGISERSILQTVFGNAADDLSRAPGDTSLQRAMLEHVSSGRAIDPRAGKCFMFPEDLDWGRQVYRTTKFPWHLVGD